MERQRLSHAYLMAGVAGAARDENVNQLAAALLCSNEPSPCGKCRDCRKVAEGLHPDLIRVHRMADSKKGTEKAEIYVEQIRQLISDAIVVPNESLHKVYIIEEADRMNVQAQNALLKVLEEPPKHACFILAAASAEAMLPTIRSRCVIRYIAGQTEVNQEADEFAGEYLKLVKNRDRLALAKLCLGNAAQTDRLLLETYLAAIRTRLCSYTKEPEEAMRLSLFCEKLENYLQRQITPKQILGLMAAESIQGFNK